MAHLPPDLERLGDALTAAATRATTRRRTFTRCAGKLAACVTAGTIVLAAASPTHLARNEPPGPLEIAAVDQAYGGTLREPCDPPHGRNGREVQLATGCIVEDPPAQVR